MRHLVALALLCIGMTAHADEILLNSCGFEGAPPDICVAPAFPTGRRVDSSVWQASEGEFSVEVLTIPEFSFGPTLPGRFHTFKFDLAGNPLEGPPIKALGLFIEFFPITFPQGSGPHWFFFDTTGKDPENMGWEEVSASFLMPDLPFPGIRLNWVNISCHPDVLEFQGCGTNFPGPAIDNLRLFASVPEPGFLALLSIVLAGLSFARRRRPQMSST